MDVLTRNGEMVKSLCDAVHKGTGGIQLVHKAIRSAVKEGYWRHFRNLMGAEVKHESFKIFVEAPIAVGGLGARIEDIKKICQDDRESYSALIAALAERPEPLAYNGKHENRKNQFSVDAAEEGLLSKPSKKQKGGNKSDYLTARIARDRPDVLERMKRGEFSSVAAAAREAGIKKDPSTLTKLKNLWKKASPEERAAFFTFIETPEDCS